MESRDFCYWLNGYFELCKASGVEPNFTPDVVQVMKSHLDLVFKKVTPETTFSFPRTTLGTPPASLSQLVDPSKLIVTC